MLRFKAGDMVLRPSLVAGGLHLFAADAERWIVRDASLFHGPLEHGPQLIQEIPLREWRCSFPVDDLLHVLPREQHDAFVADGAIDRQIAMRLAEILKNVAAGALCFRGQSLEWR